MSFLVWFAIFVNVSTIVASLYFCFTIIKITNHYILEFARQETSDYRSFDCGEVVYYQQAKYFVVSSLWWSHTEDTKLVLRSINYHSEDIEVDSKQVKKVVRSFDE